MYSPGVQLIREAKEDYLLGGKYHIPQGVRHSCALMFSHAHARARRTHHTHTHTHTRTHARTHARTHTHSTFCTLWAEDCHTQTTVLIPNQAMLRDPQLWEKPDDFLPFVRWNEETVCFYLFWPYFLLTQCVAD
jgi:cytochrome P450